MALSKEDVKRLAELARLELAPDEAERMRHELDRVLGYVNRLGNVDTTGVSEASVESAESALRRDASEPCDQAARELIMSNFPDRAGDALKVPAVFEKPKS